MSATTDSRELPVRLGGFDTFDLTSLASGQKLRVETAKSIYELCIPSGVATVEFGDSSHVLSGTITKSGTDISNKLHIANRFVRIGECFRFNGDCNTSPVISFAVV